MKILHINSYYSTTGLFKNLYDRQVTDNINIDVYVPISYQYPQERLAVSGEYTLVSRNHHALERYIFHLKHRNILKDLKKKYHLSTYDIIHAHSLFSNGWLAYQLHKEFNIPYVVAVRSADVRTFFNKMPWLKNLGLNILQNAAQIVFISKNSYLEVFDQYIPAPLKEPLNRKVTIISNGIDDFWLENIYEEKVAQLHHPLKIISVGKTLPEKRFVQLADMIKAYNDNFEPAQLHIVGPAWNTKIAEQLNNHPIVHYHGPKSKEALKALFREMDLFALLSSRETFGLVYPEAMSQGLPVIYTKHEGFDSFFDNGHVGISLDKNDQLGLIKAIEFIKKNYGTLTKNAINGAKIFNWNSIHQQYLSLYNDILK